MKHRKLLALSIAIGTCLASTQALACGESMFHTGQGMRYHTFITRRPAEILVYSPGQWKSGAAQAELYSGLEKAGHKITVVGDTQALASALKARQYDVIIAGSGEMDAVAAQIVKTSREPSFIAVLGDGAGNDAHLRDRYPRSVHEGDDLNQYLKSIEKTMETRGT